MLALVCGRACGKTGSIFLASSLLACPHLLQSDYLRALERHRLEIIPIDGDGNCLFRSVSHQVRELLRVESPR